MHSLEVSSLSECSDEIAADPLRFGIDCIKNLLKVQEIHVSFASDVSRLKNDAFASALARGAGDQNTDVIAITNATILTMESGSLHHDLVEDAVMVIRGGVIDSVGSMNAMTIPQGATVLNAGKGFIVPGFIDVHAHWSGFGDLYPARSWEMDTFLAYGVTTLHK